MPPPRTVHDDGRVRVVHGNALDALRGMPPGSVDAVCTDPPYEYGFMGRAWDASGIAYDVALWAEALRVLKPGGHLLAFGGTRTSHRLACAIEDAGFEIRDTITWLYGSGFPKSLDVGKAIDKAAGAEREIVGEGRWSGRESSTDLGVMNDDAWQGGAARLMTAPATEDAARWQGWGRALKPASEPIVVARKPLAGTVAGNVLAHGTGALNIDACRVDSEGPHGTRGRNKFADFDQSGRTVYNKGAGSLKSPENPAGRWPSNVVLTHAQAVDGGDACADGCVPGCPVAELDTQSGHQRDGVAVRRNGVSQGDIAFGTVGKFAPGSADVTYGGEGGASRFFPTFRYEAKADTAQRPRAGMVAHPTVKPLALIRWLVRLITPPGGTVLDLFAGSGTTGEAARLEGMRGVLIERETDYLPLILDRLTRRTDPAAHLLAKAARGEDVDLGLFADLEGA